MLHLIRRQMARIKPLNTPQSCPVCLTTLKARCLITMIYQNQNVKIQEKRKILRLFCSLKIDYTKKAASPQEEQTELSAVPERRAAGNIRMRQSIRHWRDLSIWHACRAWGF